MRTFISLLAILTVVTFAPKGSAQEQATEHTKECAFLFKHVNEEKQDEVIGCKIMARALLTVADLSSVPGISLFSEIDVTNKNITPATAIALVERIAIAVENLPKDRINSKSSRFIRGCLNADQQNGIGSLLASVFDSCSIRRSNTPNTRAASQPALISFARDLDAIDEDQENTFQIAAAFRGTKGLNADTALSFATEFQRNTAEGSEQSNLAVSLGAIYDVAPSAVKLRKDLQEQADTDENPYAALNGFFSLRFSGELTYNRMGIFGDADSEPCMLTPDAEFCRRQDLESIRFVGNLSPYFDALNTVRVNKKVGDLALAWAVSPVFGVFYDEALNDNVVLATGEPVDGSVFGVTAGVSASISPGVFRNRWQLSGSVQVIEALDRSTGRVENFDQTSTEFITALSYAFRDNSYVGQTNANQIVPAIAITYANGSDPLRGRTDRESLTISFSLLY